MLSHVVLFVYVFLLFFVLTPGVLVTLPRKASKMVVAAVHAVIFALIWALTHKLVLRAVKVEGLIPQSHPGIVSKGTTTGNIPGIGGSSVSTGNTGSGNTIQKNPLTIPY
jgi:hypothetical protein